MAPAVIRTEAYRLYDGKSLVKRTDGHIEGHIEVRIKGLMQSQIDAKRLDKAEVDRIADEIIAGHAPAIALVSDLSDDQRSQILIEEDIANRAQIQPTIRMLAELDCAALHGTLELDARSKHRRAMDLDCRRDAPYAHLAATHAVAPRRPPADTIGLWG